MNIYDFNDYRSYLNELLLAKKAANKSYSMRAWSKKLGIDATLLHKVLKGERSIPSAKIASISAQLQLNQTETDYFQLMIDHDQTLNKKIKEIIRQEMQLLKKQSTIGKISSTQFEQIDFTDAVILEMTKLSNSIFCTKEVAAKCHISPEEAEIRIQKLASLGMLQNLGNSYIKSTDKQKYKINFAQENINSYFKEMNQQSNRSIDKGDPQKKVFRTRVVCVSKENGPIFAKMIDRFLAQLDEAFTNDTEKDCIACINLQYFRLWEE